MITHHEIAMYNISKQQINDLSIIEIDPVKGNLVWYSTICKVWHNKKTDQVILEGWSAFQDKWITLREWIAE